MSLILIRKVYSYIVVNNLWLALEWYIPMLALHVFEVVLVCKRVFSHIRDDMSSKQARRYISLWWGSPQSDMGCCSMYKGGLARETMHLPVYGHMQHLDTTSIC